MDIDATQVLDLGYDDDEAEESLNNRKEVGSLKTRQHKHFPATTLTVYEGVNIIGRTDQADIVIKAKGISKKHACIEVQADDIMIYDCGSVNKTRKGKMLLKPFIRYELKDEDEITFGDIHATFSVSQPQEKGTSQDVDVKNQDDEATGSITDAGSETDSESMIPLLQEDENNAEQQPADVKNHETNDIVKETEKEEVAEENLNISALSNLSDSILLPTQVEACSLLTKKKAINEKVEDLYAADTDSESETENTPEPSTTATVDTASTAVTKVAQTPGFPMSQRLQIIPDSPLSTSINTNPLLSESINLSAGPAMISEARHNSSTSTSEKHTVLSDSDQYATTVPVDDEEIEENTAQKDKECELSNKEKKDDEDTNVTDEKVVNENATDEEVAAADEEIDEPAEAICGTYVFEDFNYEGDDDDDDTDDEDDEDDSRQMEVQAEDNICVVADTLEEEEEEDQLENEDGEKNKIQPDDVSDGSDFTNIEASQEIPLVGKRCITSTQLKDGFKSFGTPTSSISANMLKDIVATSVDQSDDKKIVYESDEESTQPYETSSPYKQTTPKKDIFKIPAPPIFKSSLPGGCSSTDDFHEVTDATTHMSSSDDDAPKNLLKKLPSETSYDAVDVSTHMSTEEEISETNFDNVATQAFDNVATQAYDNNVATSDDKDLDTQMYAGMSTQMYAGMSTQMYAGMSTQAYADIATQAYTTTTTHNEDKDSETETETEEEDDEDKRNENVETQAYSNLAVKEETDDETDGDMSFSDFATQRYVSDDVDKVLDEPAVKEDCLDTSATQAYVLNVEDDDDGEEEEKEEEEEEVIKPNTPPMKPTTRGHGGDDVDDVDDDDDLLDNDKPDNDEVEPSKASNLKQTRRLRQRNSKSVKFKDETKNEINEIPTSTSKSNNEKTKVDTDNIDNTAKSKRKKKTVVDDNIDEKKPPDLPTTCHPLPEEKIRKSTRTKRATKKLTEAITENQAKANVEDGNATNKRTRKTKNKITENVDVNDEQNSVNNEINNEVINSKDLNIDKVLPVKRSRRTKKNSTNDVEDIPITVKENITEPNSEPSSRTSKRGSRKKKENNENSDDVKNETVEVTVETDTHESMTSSASSRKRPSSKVSNKTDNSNDTKKKNNRKITKTSDNIDDAQQKTNSRKSAKTIDNNSDRTQKNTSSDKTTKSTDSENPQNNNTTSTSTTTVGKTSSKHESRRSSAGALKPKVVFTGISNKAVEKVVHDLGGQVVDNVQTATHLVTDKVRRTVKFLCAIGRGLPIVTPDWLMSSKEIHTFTAWKDYILMDEAAEKQYKFHLKRKKVLHKTLTSKIRSINRAIESSLLKDYSVYVTKNVKPEPKNMKEMIICCGGKFLSKVPRTPSDDVIVISCAEDEKEYNKLVERGFCVCSNELLLTGILRQELDVKQYSIANDAMANPDETMQERPTRKRTASTTTRTNAKRKR